ncbi:MAG TPA: acetate kinase [Elusimicrobia bacterium]|nr:acetate kinase [Elusimicrobiota bacterium]
MKILVLNFRIYSVEYELFEMPSETEICKGELKHIGFDDAILTYTVKNKTTKIVKPVLNHTAGLEFIIDTLKKCCIKSTDEIDAVGHRVVHGGWSFRSSVLIDDRVKKEIESDFLIAPIHNPYNLKGINAAEKLLPGKKNVAVFDTSFHQTLPEVAFKYALPERLEQEYKIRKYGFHGISHKYVSQKTAQLLGKKKTTMLSFHLGAGSSICAIKDGKSVDTSMGFTPLEGLVMTDRCGDLDCGVVIYLMKLGWTLTEIENCLNRESGTLGVSGLSDEMKEVVEEAKNGNERAKLAVDIFIYIAGKYLGAYYFVLGGEIEAISFTGAIGNNSPYIREKILSGLEKFGIKLDRKKNDKIIGEEGEISTEDAKIRIFVIPRNEKIQIAKETMEVINGKII